MKNVPDPPEIYHKHPAINSGKIIEVLRSPLHYKSRFIDGNERKQTPAMLFGQICHAALLEPHRFQENFVIKPEFKGEGSRKAKAEWEASLPPAAIVLDQEDADTIVGMTASLLKHPGAAFLLKQGIAEQSLYFEDEVTGLPCKVRPDFLSESGFVINFKTTTDASKRSFSRDIWTYKYHIAAGLYLTGFKKVFGREAKGYAFIAVE